MDNIDCVLHGIRELRWLPWIGERYAETKLLLIKAYYSIIWWNEIA